MCIYKVYIQITQSVPPRPLPPYARQSLVDAVSQQPKRPAPPRPARRLCLHLRRRLRARPPPPRPARAHV